MRACYYGYSWIETKLHEFKAFFCPVQKPQWRMTQHSKWKEMRIVMNESLRSIASTDVLHLRSFSQKCSHMISSCSHLTLSMTLTMMTMRWWVSDDRSLYLWDLRLCVCAQFGFQQRHLFIVRLMCVSDFQLWLLYEGRDMHTYTDRCTIVFTW